jgi:hypothetical protein
VQVLISRDRVWRVEIRAGYCTVYEHGALVLDRVGLDRVVTFLLDQGVNPEQDLIPD